MKSKPSLGETFEVFGDLKGLDSEKTFEVSETSKVSIEYESCYRGKIEIWKDRDGKVFRMDIIR